MIAPGRGAALAGAAAALLLAGCGQKPPAGPPSPGQRLYAANCLACHQPGGEGVPGVQPPLAGTPVPTGDPQVLLRWVMFGERPAALPRGRYSGMMPQFGYLSDEDLAVLLSYVRSSFGNHAAPVTPAMVAAARSAHRGG
ncbi:MAG: cytochrome c [Proteobacteria bacterium]|nr:cytochrome c [Pseudomonadota bacterium]